MVFPHGPGKFYGSSLPRPRIYTDVKFNHERVDPPVSVVDPLLSWAHEAHWSMGGLSTKRLRLQGRIEGNISKLRAENEKLTRKMIRTSSVPETESQQSDRDEPRSSDSPPPAPVAANKKRRFLALIEEEEHEEVTASERKRPARKLINEFNSVATTATRRSPRSGNKSDPPKSRGGSFVSKMQKASENVMMMKHSKKSTPTSESESSDEEDRTEAKLKKMKSASGSPRLVRTSPRRMKKRL